MIFKKDLQKPIFAILFLSFGGWLLHFRAHNISENPAFYLPFLLGILNVVVVPVLFNWKKTALLGYLLNGFSVVIGTIVMAHLSLSGLPQPITFYHIIFRTTLADVFLLLPKLFIGHMILLHYYPTGVGRLFTCDWWVRHFAYVTIIYTMGHFLWR